MRIVAFAVAKRGLRHAFTNPALLLPSLLFPLVFLLASFSPRVAGGLRISSGPPSSSW